MSKYTKKDSYSNIINQWPDKYSGYGDDDWMYDLIKQQHQTVVEDEEKSIDSLKKELARDVQKAKEEFDKLKQQKEFVDNDLHFIFPLDQSLDEYQEWCFENDFIFVVKRCKVLNETVQALIFKNAEDAMAFKLRWL